MHQNRLNIEIFGKLNLLINFQLFEVRLLNCLGKVLNYLLKFIHLMDETVYDPFCVGDKLN